MRQDNIISDEIFERYVVDTSNLKVGYISNYFFTSDIKKPVESNCLYK